jgi:hypothetical protein
MSTTVNNTLCRNAYSPSFQALPKKYTVIDDYLIRGPHPNPVDVFKLKKEGVNQIYDFRHYGPKGFKFVERFLCKVAGINYERRAFCFLHGEFPTENEYQTIAKSVKDNGKHGGKTLFHCNSGTHRTALMSAFYDITKGENLDTVKTAKNYKENVDKVLKEQVVNTKYFSRNRVELNTKNPVKLLQNRFNNKVEKAIRSAYESFLDILSK